MLAKRNRLNRAEFSTIFQIGQRRHSINLTAIIKNSTDFKGAVVVGKKVAKKAHERNSIKRRLYDMVGNFVKINNWQGRVIFVVKPAVNRLSKRQFKIQLENEIAQVLNKT